MIEIGNITIDELVQVSVIGVEVEACANEHGLCRIKALTSQSDTVSSLLSSLKTLTVTDKKSREIIFTGVPISFKTKGSELRIELISSSSICDVKKDRATFQDIALTFLQVVEDVTNMEDIAAYTSDKLKLPIGQPVYRYEETAWQFFKRIAGMVGVPIIAKYNVLNYCMSVGLMEEHKNYPNEQLEFHEGIEQGMEFLKVKGYANLVVGDKVFYNGFEYAVKSVSANTEKGILVFEYTFVHAEELMAKYETSQALCGLILFGTVDKSETDHVLVDFDIDKGSNKTASYQYPWKTIASNMLYSMPEKDARVAVNLFDATGTMANAITCMRTGKPGFSKSDKVFEVSNGKKLSLTEKELQFFSPAENVQSQLIELGDTISVNSLKNIRIENVLGNIRITCRTIKLTATNEIIIEIGCDIPEAEIALRTTVEIDGDNVVIRAMERTSYPMIDDAPKELKLNWAKLGLKVLATVAVVAAACFVAVALAPVAAGLAGAATCTAVATATTSHVVGVAIATCACGGIALASANTYVQWQKDKDNGVDRPIEEYLYLAIDSFCTGAIMSAPSAAIPVVNDIPKLYKFIGFSGRMLTSAGMSLLYQEIDAGLDSYFGSDYYDVDSSVGLTVLFDVICNAFGEGIGSLVNCAVDGIGNYYKAHFNKYLTLSLDNYDSMTKLKAAIKQYLRANGRKAEGFNGGWWDIFVDVSKKNNKLQEIIDYVYSGAGIIPGAGNNSLWGGVDKNQEKYDEMEYFYFDENGNLIGEVYAN